MPYKVSYKLRSWNRKYRYWRRRESKKPKNKRKVKGIRRIASLRILRLIQNQGIQHRVRSILRICTTLKLRKLRILNN